MPDLISDFPVSRDPTMLESASSAAVEEPDDHSLMIAVRAGDLERLGDLFERHHRALFGFFVRMTRDRAASEDLVQVVFQRILRYRHTCRDEGRFSAWIYHLARRAAADHFRREGRAPWSDADPSPDDHPSDSPHSADQAETADDLDLMRSALAALSPEERELIVLHRLQQVPHEDIGRLVGCSAGTAKVRLHRALAPLKDRFFRLRGGRHAA